MQGVFTTTAVPCHAGPYTGSLPIISRREFQRIPSPIDRTDLMQNATNGIDLYRPYSSGRSRSSSRGIDRSAASETWRSSGTRVEWASAARLAPSGGREGWPEQRSRGAADRARKGGGGRARGWAAASAGAGTGREVSRRVAGLFV